MDKATYSLTALDMECLADCFTRILNFSDDDPDYDDPSPLARGGLETLEQIKARGESAPGVSEGPKEGDSTPPSHGTRDGTAREAWRREEGL